MCAVRFWKPRTVNRSLAFSITSTGLVVLCRVSSFTDDERKTGQRRIGLFMQIIDETQC